MQSKQSSDGPFIFHKCVFYETVIANIVRCPFIIHLSCLLNQPFHVPHAVQTQRKTNTIYPFMMCVTYSRGPVCLLPKIGFIA